MKVAAPVEPEGTKAIHMLFEKSLLKQIEDYRFQNRYSTRVEAIKSLIKLGLAQGLSTSQKTKRNGP